MRHTLVVCVLRESRTEEIEATEGSTYALLS